MAGTRGDDDRRLERRDGGAQGRRSKKKRPTDAEARAAVKTVLLEVFDLPSVLRGRKPLSALTGLWYWCGTLALVFVQQYITVVRQNMSRAMVGSMYLRNTQVFFLDLGRSMAVSLLSSCVSSLNRWLLRRADIAWEKELTTRLHAKWFGTMRFYHQANSANAIPDPAQRIVRDVKSVSHQLASLCYRSVSSVLDAVFAVTRLVYHMPGRAYYVPLIVVYSWVMLLGRNYLTPALLRGMMMAKQSRISGAWRDAHSKLATHAEAIISFGGVGAEARRIAEKLDESLSLSRRFTLVMVREDIVKDVTRRIISQTFMECLYQLPVLSAFHPMKVPATASQAVRMRANANLLGEMQFTGQLVRSCHSELDQVTRMGRTTMMMGGYAIRVAEMLRDQGHDQTAGARGRRQEGADSQGASQQRNVAVGAEPAESTAIICRGLDVRTPTGVELIDDLSFSIERGQSLMVCGAAGVGKTSILRCLKGLWETELTLSKRTISLPENVLFVPQTPYLPARASLQDQLTYPKRLAAGAVPEEILRRVLTSVHLEHFLDREAAAAGDGGGVDWNGALSLGERQQLALGRVLLAKPVFAVLDEATSAIEDDVEAFLFEHLQNCGITLLTVTHRASRLKRFHQQLLRIHPKASSGAHTPQKNGDQSRRNWSLKAIEGGVADDDDTSSESDFAMPLVRRSRSNPQVAGSPAATGEGKVQQRVKELPQMSDVRRTMMLVRLIVPKLTLADESILKMAAYSALISVSVYINTGFLSSIPGALQALAIESNASGYMRFQMKVLGMRLISMFISTTQQWLRSETSTIWRGRLSRAVTDRYIAHSNFFTMKHVDRRICDADTRITQEIGQVVQEMNMMVMRVLRPVFDAVYCTLLLIRVQLPFAGVLAMWSYGVISVATIKLLQPDFAHLVTEQGASHLALSPLPLIFSYKSEKSLCGAERTSAEFRTAHDRASGAAESIAFAGIDGAKLEETMVNEAHDQVLRLQQRTSNQQAVWSVVSGFVMGGMGGRRGGGGGDRGGGGGGATNLQSMITQLLRFFWSTSTQGTDGEVLSRRGGTQMAATSQFIGSLISQSFGTFSTLLSLNESFQELFGTCRRVSDVLLVINELEQERQADEERVASMVQPHTPRRGQRIGLVEATVVAPDGKQLAANLTFSVEKREAEEPPASSNLLVSGGSGVGKTTLVRLLSGLWSTGLHAGRAHSAEQAPVYTVATPLTAI